MATSDGHLARGNFSASVRALGEPTELKMLDEAILCSRAVATIADVAAYFAGAISGAARKFAGGAEAQSLLSDNGKQSLAAALMQAANAVAFACGIEILQPADVELDCPTLLRQRMEEMDRQAAQRRTAEQMEQLRRSAELFGQFQAIRTSAPELSPGQVLSRIGTSDQADVLRAALVASAKDGERSRLWAVAGNALVRIECSDSGRMEVFSVPENLGPMRSVRGDGAGAQLLGCQSGVIRFDASAPASAMEYRDPEAGSAQGFNAAVRMGGRIWATHGQAGLVCWDVDQGEKPVMAHRPGTSKMTGFSPRNLMRLDDRRLIFSSGGQLAIASAEGEISTLGGRAPADVAGIVVMGNRIVAALCDGQVCVWSGKNFGSECRQRRSGRIASAAMLPWMGDARILLATEDGPIVCVGADDELLTQYAGGYSGFRIVAASENAIAAVTADRQRVILWHPWDGKKPMGEVFVYGAAKHRVADVGFVPG